MKRRVWTFSVFWLAAISSDYAPSAHACYPFIILLAHSFSSIYYRCKSSHSRRKSSYCIWDTVGIISGLNRLSII